MFESQQGKYFHCVFELSEIGCIQSPNWIIDIIGS